MGAGGEGEKRLEGASTRLFSGEGNAKLSFEPSFFCVPCFPWSQLPFLG